MKGGGWVNPEVARKRRWAIARASGKITATGSWTGEVSCRVTRMSEICIQHCRYAYRGDTLSAVTNTGSMSVGMSFSRPSAAVISGRSTPSESSIFLAPA